MKKIVILSDTHGNLSAIYSVYDILLESDMVFHLGDHYDDMNELESVLGDKLYRVYGNCDFGRNPKEISVEVEGVKLFATRKNSAQTPFFTDIPTAPKLKKSTELPL